MQRQNTSFAHAVRLDQGRFRDTSSTISSLGRTPTDEKGLRHPHLLASGCEEENFYPGIRGPGGAVGFFAKRGIRWWKSSRSGDDNRLGGPTRNMVSSQIACVNFLLPLAGVPGALLAVIRAIDTDVTGVLNITTERNSSPVEFEWTGLGGSLEGTGTRGANATSIDAFLVRVRWTGAIPWAWASAQVIRPFPLSSRRARAPASGTGLEGRRNGWRGPRRQHDHTQ